MRRGLQRNRYRRLQESRSPDWEERKRMIEEQTRAALAEDAELDRLAKAQGA
jgi:SpoVK/Ycf46/Vps4 family AAA+-type ATPase